MNEVFDLSYLKNTEAAFLARYPLGFRASEFCKEKTVKKTEELIQFSQNAFIKAEFLEPLLIIDNMLKVVSRSPWVSMFEKPKYKTFVYSLSATRQVALAESLKKILHGKEEKGFDAMQKILAEGGLSQWTLSTIFAAYFRPDQDVLINPTVTKTILKNYKINHIIYDPKPSIDFYQSYRSLMLDMKKHVCPQLASNTTEFCSFMALDFI